MRSGLRILQRGVYTSELVRADARPVWEVIWYGDVCGDGNGGTGVTRGGGVEEDGVEPGECVGVGGEEDVPGPF